MKNIKKIIFLILFTFFVTFADSKQTSGIFSYKLPFYKDSSIHSIWINAQYSNPSFTIFLSLLNNSTDQYGGSIGYAQTWNNFIKWSIGIGVLYGGHEYSSGYSEYNKSIYMQLPISFSVGKKGYDKFTLKMGIRVTPFLTLYTKEYSDSNVEFGLGSEYNNSYNEITPGAHFALLPQLVWYNPDIPTAFTMTLFSPGILYFDDHDLEGGFTISTHFTLDFFLRVREE